MGCQSILAQVWTNIMGLGAGNPARALPKRLQNCLFEQQKAQ